MEFVMTSIGDGEVIQVNAVADIEAANKWAIALENREAHRLGLPVRHARRKVASRLGICPGTLENIRRFRTKIVPNWLMTRMRAEFVAVLQREIQALEHEIHLARQTGADHRDDDLAKAEAQLVAAKNILEKT